MLKIDKSILTKDHDIRWTEEELDWWLYQDNDEFKTNVGELYNRIRNIYRIQIQALQRELIIDFP